MPREIVSFVPGPAHVRREVLDAMAAAPTPHRGPAVVSMVRRVQHGLATLAGGGSAFPALCSGTAAIELALAGVARSRLLVVSGGAFGDRIERIGSALGLTVERLAVPPGWPVDADLVERALAAGSFDTVAVVHCETQTGALSDVAAIAAAVAGHPGTALVVDAVSSFGGVELALADLGPEAVLVSVSGKALACPPGVAVVALTDGAAERARGSERGGLALRLEHLVDAAQRGQTPQTPSVPLLHALDAQLPRLVAEGLDRRAARHRRMAELVQAWAEERFAVLAREDARSPTVTAIENTRGIDVARLRSEVAKRGFRIADGYADLAGATFRIGHMGDVTVAQTQALLAALDEALAAIGAG